MQPMEKVNTAPAENKMGVMPVNKLLLNMSLPMVVAMLVQALYNVVDSVFVSRISEDALTAVSLAFPLQNLMIAVAVGTGVGINALLSRSLGEKNQERVNQTAINGIFLAVLSWLLFLVVGLFFVKPFFASQTQNLVIREHGEAYLSICCIFSFGLFGQIAFERILQSTGRTVLTMISQSIGALINIVLDPILIFGYFGFPKMGVTGAAVATVFGQIFAMCLSVYLNHKKNRDVVMNFRGFRPNGEVIRRIFAVGLPSIIMQSIGSVMTFCINQILLAFTSTAAAVFGVYFKLQSFIFMPVFGLNNGMVPIISYNYGARRKERIEKTIVLSMLYAEGIMVIGFLLFQFAPVPLLKLFNASDDMLLIGTQALSTISWHFLIAGLCIVAGSVFQALGNGMMSLIVSIARQLIVLIPAAYLLSLSGDLNLVWWSFPIAEMMSLLASAFFMRKIYFKEILPLGCQTKKTGEAR
ncbi:MAG: MATE family efflux transporter [Clostridia bacterium]